MSPYIGYDSDTAFIPGTLNTSSSLTIQGGGITQTGGDVNLDNGTLFLDEDLNRVGVGTTTPTVTLEVVGVVGANIFSNPQVISTNASVPPGQNAVSFGPIVSIGDGYEVVVGDTSFWTIKD